MKIFDAKCIWILVPKIIFYSSTLVQRFSIVFYCSPFFRHLKMTMRISRLFGRFRIDLTRVVRLVYPTASNSFASYDSCSGFTTFFTYVWVLPTSRRLNTGSTYRIPADGWSTSIKDLLLALGWERVDLGQWLSVYCALAPNEGIEHKPTMPFDKQSVFDGWTECISVGYSDYLRLKKKKKITIKMF